MPRTSAEPALRFLSENSLLDRGFDLKSQGQTVSIPLSRQLEGAEVDMLRSKVEGTILGQDEFEPRTVLPRTLEEALAGDIPAESLARLPGSFDIVGDIAVLEFSSNMFEYEEKIANAVLEIHSNVKAVFARTGPTSGSERIRPLRHVAGEDRTETLHREFGCTFKLDLSKVFFSPRLSTEHDRVARQVVEGEQVIDMFSGAGPFSILIAKRLKDVRVDAIDSNPAAIKLLEENTRANKVDSKIRAHLGDARQVANRLGHTATRVIMNHPSAAKEFVGAACHVLSTFGGKVHYYTFAGGDDAELGAKREMETALEASNHSIRRLLGVRRVREVAPVKWQIAIDAEVTPDSPPKSRL
ncbi:class I SAM-dependent methyltransferase family protein [Candidatus Bathyarchaeota archaeon]|nr:class I SAM-dependent methyltransferase family protein [Candidatus Bathyarchaeota archaeon]